jgi:FkbM family methyltransferase
MTYLEPSQQIALGITEYLVNNGYTPTNGMNVSELYAYIKDLALLSESQMKQDIFVQNILGYKQNGYFVEFGATDGVAYSNTLLLEKQFGWAGVVSEPAKAYQTDLAANRSCVVETRCVWSESNQMLQFNETTDFYLSTLNQFTNYDSFAKDRVTLEMYDVTTISLNDLLAAHNAPTDVDYISVDTKGGEIDILLTFDFAKYNVSVFTVNHDFTPERQQIYDLMLAKGYVRVANEVSFMDDWYIKPSLLGTLGNTDNPNFNDTQPPVLTFNGIL